jgi:hypothetical protein
MTRVVEIDRLTGLNCARSTFSDLLDVANNGNGASHPVFAEDNWFRLYPQEVACESRHRFRGPAVFPSRDGDQGVVLLRCRTFIDDYSYGPVTISHDAGSS